MNWADYFYYDETSPSCLRWKVDRGARAKVGRPAGYVHKRVGDGRLTCRVNLGDGCYLVHRVIWELLNGPIPDGKEIDHKNGNALSNVVSNLRIVDDLGNAQNKAMYGNNSSGVTGVSRTMVRGNQYWTCAWTNENGKRKGRMFSINKYGECEARALAVAAREEAMKGLEGYTERHGK